MTSRLKILDSILSKKRISKKALFAFLFYLILPTVAILMVISAYPELSKDRLIGILQRTIPISILLILVSQLSIRYEKGTKKRFALNEMYVLLVVLWLFALLGGEPIIHQTWEEYQFSLYIWNYLALILFVTGMNVVYYILEYKAYNEKDVAGKELESKEKADKEDLGAGKGVIITTIQVQ